MLLSTAVGWQLKMEKCVFCQIVNKEIPCFKVFENEKFLAFLDIKPRNEGHTLIIPKKHYRWVWEVPEIGEYFEVVKKVSLAIKKAMNTDWIISLVLGQEVPHAHVWLVPRFLNDGHGNTINFSLVKKVSKETMEKIAQKIAKEIEN